MPTAAATTNNRLRNVSRSPPRRNASNLLGYQKGKK